MSEVSVKFLMPMKVAYLEKKWPREEIGKAIERVSQVLKEKKVKLAGDAMALLHEDPKTIDLQKALYEICIPISGKVKGQAEIRDKELEKAAFASITHSGPLEKVPEVYQAILKWVEENGYRIAGPVREVYRRGIGDAGGPLPEVAIEVLLPVRK